jgi:glutamate/tyrosine decarboxylase-like PLP-dependent enzyme
MHTYRPEMDEWASAIVDYALERVKMSPPPLDGPRSPAELDREVGPTITEDGIGGMRAFELFAEHLAPATISTDHPLFAAFVPGAPTKASVLFDILVGASSICGSSWTEGAGAIYAENQALAYLAGLAGLPEGAGGAFVSGGSAGNLAGLVAARHAASERRGAERGSPRPLRWRLVAAADAHSSIAMTARIMDVDVVEVPSDERGRLTGEGLDRALDAADTDGIFAVCATAGTTNAGVVDDLAGVADVCGRRDLWMHVDGAYGGAGLAAPSVRALFDGIERADSFVVDPHKWLFAPFDCAAILYRDSRRGAAAHTQEAEYLEDINQTGEWNPPHYAYHLTRRVRGLPFWYSLATHGTRAYSEAVEAVLALTRGVADEIRRREDRGWLRLVAEPQLSVVLFERTGWSAQEYSNWCERMLAEQRAFCQPTTWRGRRCMRLCFVNPTTRVQDVADLLDTMR